MKYYEISFYYYGENDERNDMENEYTFYISSDKSIETLDELISYLKENFSKKKGLVERRNFVPKRDYEHISNWFEISKKNFENVCRASHLLGIKRLSV